MNKWITLKIIGIVLLCISFFDVGYFFYQLLRWYICLLGLYIVFWYYEKKDKILWVWIFGLIAVIFNPIAPIHFKHDIWVILDVIVMVILWYNIKISYLNNDIKNIIDEDEPMNHQISQLKSRILEKDYEGVIRIHKSLAENFLDTIEDSKLKETYFILIGASYQELGDMDMADIYFDYYLDNLYIQKEQIELMNSKWLDELSVKMIYLINELNNFWLWYKTKKEEYDNI